MPQLSRILNLGIIALMCVLVMSYMFMLPVSTTADEDVYH